MTHCGPLLRGTTLWLVVTAVAAGGAHLAGGHALALRHGIDTAGLEVLLVRGSAAAVLVCLAWGWLTTSVVLVETATGVRTGATVPSVVRRAVLTACGLALAGGLTAPAAVAGAAGGGGGGALGPAAHPDTVGRGGGPAVLDGLPLPDRAVGRSGARDAASGRDLRHVTVRVGDSLWVIAARDLPSGATPAMVAARVGAIHQLNRAAIGPDPDLVHPGQRLRLPR